MNKPLITKRADGEYSTVVFNDGTIETVWFPNTGPSRVVGRTVPNSVHTAARNHIREWEEK